MVSKRFQDLVAQLGDPSDVQREALLTARYRCKDCAKTFDALTGTPLAQLHCRDVWSWIVPGSCT